MDCFINENHILFEENSQCKDIGTDHQDDIAIFFEETFFNFKSSGDQLSQEAQPVSEEIKVEMPRDYQTN
jgi:hypothetical protein